MQNCYNCWLKDTYSKTPNNSINTKWLIEGPQGSGKTTFANILTKNLGTSLTRGFPNGNEILAANSQEEICSLAYREKMHPVNGYHTTVFDRSPISQHAFELRTSFSNHDSLITEGAYHPALDCAINGIKYIAKENPVHLIFMNSTPELCIERQGKSMLSIKDQSTAALEISAYNLILNVLSKSNIPNLKISSINNLEQTNLEQIAYNFLNNNNGRV